jgi:hypothetical protein
VKQAALLLLVFGGCTPPVQGPAGPAGVCDTSTCPQSTSIDGLSGGVVSSNVSIDGSLTTKSGVVTEGTVSAASLIVNGGTANLNSAPVPKGVVTYRGEGRVSTGGFYCGRTTFDVDGSFFNNQVTYTNLNALTSKPLYAKRHCTDVCGDDAAHPCLTTEILDTIYLSEGVNRNFVPLPDGDGWVLSPDLVSSCGDATNQGITYVKNAAGAYAGWFERRACTETRPLLCCL